MTDHDKGEKKVLGDIDPPRRLADADRGARDSVTANDETHDPLAARKDRDPETAKRSGSRDVTGGDSTVSGTRNMRSTGGAVGSDLGNRPE